MVTDDGSTAYPRAEVKAHLQRMDNEDFEHFVAELWERRGWETEVTRRARDKSLDVQAETEDPFFRRQAIQAKRFKEGNNVSGPKVSEYAALTDHFDADVAVVVTTSGFTRDARERAEELKVKRVDGDRLVSMIDDADAYDLVEKYTDFERGPPENASVDGDPPEERPPVDGRPDRGGAGHDRDGVLRVLLESSWRVTGYAAAATVLSFVLGVFSTNTFGEGHPVTIAVGIVAVASFGGAGLFFLVSLVQSGLEAFGVQPIGRSSQLRALSESRIAKYGALLAVPLVALPFAPEAALFFPMGLVQYYLGRGALALGIIAFEDGYQDRSRVNILDGPNGSSTDEREKNVRGVRQLALPVFGVGVIALLAGAVPPKSIIANAVAGNLIGATLVPVAKLASASLDLSRLSQPTGEGPAVDGGTVDGASFGDSVTETSVEGYVLPMDIQLDEHDLTADDQGHVEIQRHTSTLLAGATRSGKSEAAKVLVYQMIDGWTATEPLIAYDRKDDWQQFFREHGVDFEVMSADPEEATVTWDLFGEVEDEQDFTLIAKALIEGDPDESGGKNEFFEDAGRDVFEVLCKYLWRTFGEQDETPTNEDIVRYVETRTREEAYEDFSHYDDLRLAAEQMDPDAHRMAAGVWANLTQEIKDIFVGTFRSPPEDMERVSLRQYYADPGGRALVLSHPFRYGDAVERVYKYLIDDAIRRGLGQSGGSVLILDELPQLPELDNLDELVNVGAGKDVRSLVTLQSIGQLRSTYGEDEAASLLAGMPTKVLLRAGDPETVETYQNIIGQQFERVRSVNLDLEGGDNLNEEKRDPFDEAFLTAMDPGECVINRPQGWVHGRLDTLDGGAREYIDRLNGR